MLPIRSDAGLVPTAAGQRLFELTRQLQDELDRFGESITELKGIDRGVVSVGVVSTARYFAPMVLIVLLLLLPRIMKSCCRLEKSGSRSGFWSSENTIWKDSLTWTGLRSMLTSISAAIRGA